MSGRGSIYTRFNQVGFQIFNPRAQTPREEKGANEQEVNNNIINH